MPAGEKLIPAIDLTRQYQEIKAEVDTAIARVLAKGNFILGEEVEKFEAEFAGYVGARYGVGVSCGTEALCLSLLALGVGRSDEVITAANTAVPTISAITRAGATPVLVDNDPETYTMDMSRLEAAITPRTKAIMPVHLYGNVADMEPLMKVAGRHKLAVVEDACQAHGAGYKGKKVGTIGALGAFSFYPTKNLGCYGDGGMIVTDDTTLAGKLRLLRFYGMADKEKYIHVIDGVNSRLDEIQAAVLRVKLRHLDRWTDLRRARAALYSQLLPCGSLVLPREPPYARHVFHLFVVRAQRREELRTYLESHKIQTLIHYPTPIHLQPVYAQLDLKAGAFPAAEKCAREVLSLPMFPELREEEIERVARAICRFYE